MTHYVLQLKLDAGELFRALIVPEPVTGPAVRTFYGDETDTAARDAWREDIVTELGGWNHVTIYYEGVDSFFSPPPKT